MKSVKAGITVIAAILCAVVFGLCACGSDGGDQGGKAPVDDGVYTVDVDTGSNMFKVNEANKGKGLLTVKDGEMTLHISLVSKKIVNVFPGTKDEAEAAADSDLIGPTTDSIKYDDGIVEDVYGFDIPVPVLGEPFPVSVIGTKDNWYEHEMTVTDPVEGNSVPGLAGEDGEAASADESKGDLKASDKNLEDLEDGEYKAIVSKEGGSGRADIESPAKLVIGDGKATLTLVWSSPYYDYMLVDGEKYEPVNTEGNSTFEIPVKVLNEPFPVVADTTAMSKPHEIDYSITCSVAE